MTKYMFPLLAVLVMLGLSACAELRVTQADNDYCKRWYAGHATEPGHPGVFGAHPPRCKKS